MPIHNVEPYLDACLGSVADQAVQDFQAVLVDDGSTDASAEIASRRAANDPRFLLVRQENRGPGHARNTGLRYASGEYFAFLDGDDVVPRDAYRLLISTLDRTGSDFALGNVHRVDSSGTWQAPMYAGLVEGHEGTHVTEFDWLLRDHLVHNKVWRRTFWRRRRLRFPTGVLYEDVAMMLKAHYRARAVDVLAEVVVLWRCRESGEPSITQSRTADIRHVRDRVAAVAGNSRFFAEHQAWGLKSAYDTLVLSRDLRYFVDLYDRVDEEYRRQMRRLIRRFLTRVTPESLGGVSALNRLKYELLARGDSAALIDVIQQSRAGAISEDSAAARLRQLRHDPSEVLPGEGHGIVSEALGVHRG